MNILLWVLQVITALLFGASGVMKVFMFDKVSHDVPSFGALPRRAWTTLGIVELVGTVGLVVPAAMRWHPRLTVLAAAVLAVESVVFVWVHVRYREMTPIVMSGVLASSWRSSLTAGQFSLQSSDQVGIQSQRQQGNNEFVPNQVSDLTPASVRLVAEQPLRPLQARFL